MVAIGMSSNEAADRFVAVVKVSATSSESDALFPYSRSFGPAESRGEDLPCSAPRGLVSSVGSSGSLVRDEGSGLSVEEFNEMGPIDYLLVEWPGRQPSGEVAPHLVDLVDRGLIRILDLTFITKAEDGSIASLEIADVGGEVAEMAIFEGASSGLLSDEDIAEAGGALEPGTSAALLVFENTWAAPFASAVRRSGGQLVASGRIPVQAVLAALDAAEA